MMQSYMDVPIVLKNNDVSSLMLCMLEGEMCLEDRQIEYVRLW